jgi:DNA-binding NtrC family response regulator
MSNVVILCVDNDRASLKARALLLIRAGYQLLTTTNVEAALQLFRLNPVDLVIIDPPPGEVPGAGVIGEMKRIRPQVPIILLTGQMGLPPGSEQADLLLSKGTSPPDFIAVVDAIVVRGRASGEEGGKRP